MVLVIECLHNIHSFLVASVFILLNSKLIPSQDGQQKIAVHVASNANDNVIDRENAFGRSTTRTLLWRDCTTEFRCKHWILTQLGCHILDSDSFIFPPSFKWHYSLLTEETHVEGISYCTDSTICSRMHFEWVLDAIFQECALSREHEVEDSWIRNEHSQCTTILHLNP